MLCLLNLNKLLLFCCLLIWLPLTAQQDSTQDGKYRVYHHNGKMALDGAYKDTLRHGTWEEFDTDGWLQRKTRYRRGKIIWIKIYREGRLAEVINRKGKVKKMKDCGC